MATASTMVRMFIRKVKSRYLAISGTLIDVGGRIFDTRSRNTTRARSMEIHISYLIIIIIMRNLYSAIMPLGGYRGAGRTGR